MKILFTAERIASVCSVTEYFLIMGKHMGTALNILPRMVTDDEGKYIIEPVYNEDGSIKEYKNEWEAIKALNKIPVQELTRIAGEIAKACGDIINPPKGEGLKAPSPSEPEPPQPG